MAHRNRTMSSVSSRESVDTDVVYIAFSPSTSSSSLGAAKEIAKLLEHPARTWKPLRYCGQGGIVHIFCRLGPSIASAKVSIVNLVHTALSKSLKTLAGAHKVCAIQLGKLHGIVYLARRETTTAALTFQGVFVSRCNLATAFLSDRIIFVQVVLEGSISFSLKSCSYIQRACGDAMYFIKAHCHGGIDMACAKVSGAFVFLRAECAAGLEFVNALLLDACKSTKSAIVDLISLGLKGVTRKGYAVLVHSVGHYAYALTFVGHRITSIKAMLVHVHQRTWVRGFQCVDGMRACLNSVLHQGYPIAVSTYLAAKGSLEVIADQAVRSLNSSAELSRVEASAIAVRTKELAVEKAVLAAATSGAVLMGAGGVVAGLGAGGLIGAICGVPFAFFTLGISIPLGAAIGGGAGACGGAVVCGAAGAASGSAIGVAVRHRAEILHSADEAMSKVRSCRECLRNSASSSAKGVVARLRSGTGGTV